MMCRIEGYGFINLSYYLHFDVIQKEIVGDDYVNIYLECVKDFDSASVLYGLDYVHKDHNPRACVYFYQEEIANAIRNGAKYLDFEEITMGLNEKFEQFGMVSVIPLKGEKE